MDLNGECFKTNCGDTTLSLNCLGYGVNEVAGFGNFRTENGSKYDDGCRLVLGLGPTPSTYSDDHSSSRLDKGKCLSSSFHCDSILKLGLSGGGDEMSTISDYSDVSVSGFGSGSGSGTVAIPLVDEGSTSAKKSGGYMPTILFAPRVNFTSKTSTNTPKKCKFEGCSKGARGATGLCIGHGGGQRCQKPGCNKGAESRTAYCKAHGGGKRCQHLGCTKSAEGKTDLCIAHGGGRRCGHPTGCDKAARGKSGLCIKHGGGKRCKVENCTRSAEGQIGLCISHGGGRRCLFSECLKGAQGSTLYCKAHGGGKRCVFAGCTKGAEGSTPLCKGHGGGKRCLFDGGGICPKSVHGGTNFCVAHGGGKRCSVPECTKSARGRTDCCVKHGGGKRCRSENCGKSAQGSTEFCKAHGGGKRCNWGGGGKCEKFARGRNGFCAGHGSLVQDQEMKRSGGMIGPGLFKGLVRSEMESSSAVTRASVVSDSGGGECLSVKRRQLIPCQVLVPLSMKSCPSSFSRRTENGEQSMRNGFNFGIPEGRVHGGGLLSLLGGDLNNAIDGI
ncbi:probable WRKY transcription factor 19 [Impatiens glandulifera]|uniref:probable WRKY transcription factor 19 n=1 Tax=Impatiens glandulifera TaxID=253017 RepID=UPI001FB1790B|nr:probable WRKY transcription factor 19 [Impatiens glandulifera]